MSMAKGLLRHGFRAALLVVAAAASACTPAPTDQEPVGAAGEALVIGGLFSTGVNAVGNPIANNAVDPHYTLSSTDPVLPGPNAVAVNPAGGWTGNTATSKWISGRANTQGANGAVYTYTATFTLAGVDPTSATLTGRWACDDSCVLRLNGTQVAQYNSPAWGAAVNFNVPAGSPFVLGTNTLAFVVTNASGGPTGLEVVTLTGNVNGCNADAQCSAAQYCNNPTATCVTKLANGTPIPTVAGHNPALNGTCTAGAGAAVCTSGVCDTNDDDCGYANGDGPCTTANGGTVCRSGACSVDGTCIPAGSCNVDGDCSGGKWCAESTHTCTAKLANGSQIPSDPPHVGPVLDGTCTAAAAALVCVSGVCDVADDGCGYASGAGPCTVASGPTVCRTGACSPNGGVCTPVGGCAVDADCAASEWCNTLFFQCFPGVPNGQPVPTVAGHAPPLTGACTAAAGAAVCASGVCDTLDDDCGYADGDGPCTAANGGTVCRSGVCSADGTCQPGGGCNVDADCNAATQYCDTPSHACTAKKPNGAPIPSVQGHAPPLDGVCSAAEAMVACQSGVCDTLDNECGYADGDGPCTAADGATVCRSAICATQGPNQGTCVACDADADCTGQEPVCDPATNVCVQCTPGNAAQCTGATPVCDAATSTCVPATGCHSDADCKSDQWCDAAPGAAGACVAKLDNGKPLPSSPPDVSTCTGDVGSRVCKSGVCDPADDECGLAPNDGPCAADGECRNGDCDTTKQKCAGGPVPCAADTGCAAGDFCEAGSCVPKLPVGAACDRSSQCQTAACDDQVCNGVVGSGNGLICAARPTGGPDGDGSVALLGLMLAAAGMARRRRA
jgi:hypothetical protein